MMQIAPWVYYTIIGVLVVSSITNIILALLLRSEADAICSLLGASRIKMHMPRWQGFLVGVFIGVIIAGCFGWLK